MSYTVHIPAILDENEEGYISATEQLLTEHFGFPILAQGGPADDVIRWDKPASLDDAKHGRIGSRSMMWHPARTLVKNEGGVDGKDFGRQGEQLGGEQDWWD
jgi:hypothetical protein